MNYRKSILVFLVLFMIVFLGSDTINAEKEITKYSNGKTKSEKTVDDSGMNKTVTTLIEYDQEGQVIKTERTSQSKSTNEKRILIHSDYKEITEKGMSDNEKKYTWTNEKYTYYKGDFVNYKSSLKKDLNGNEISDEVKGYFDGTKKIAYTSSIKRNSKGKRTSTIQVGYKPNGDKYYAEERLYYENGFRKERKDYYYNLEKKHLIGIMQYDDSGLFLSKKIINQEKLTK